MKKLLFLLCTVSIYGQTYQNPTFGTIKTKTAPTVTTTPHLGTVETDGTISKITPANLPVSTATQDSIDTKIASNAGLQNAYNFEPEIITSAIKGAVTVQEGTGNNATNVIVGRNNAGTNTFATRGDGMTTISSSSGASLTLGELSNQKGWELKNTSGNTVAKLTDMGASQGQFRIGTTGAYLEGREGGAQYLKVPIPIESPDPTASNHLATKSYADGLVVGLLNDRGSYDASSNLYPSTGGSGTAGAVKKGNLWSVSVAGTLGGVAVGIGDWVRALVDTPGQTSSNWSVVEGNFGYVPANDTNTVHLSGTETITGDKTVSGILTSTGGIILNSGLHASSTGAVLARSGDHLFLNSRNASFGALLNTSSIATTDKTFTFPNASGTFALTSDLSTYQPLLTNPVTGTGTSGYLPKWTGTGTQGNSLFYDDGTNIGLGTTSPLSGGGSAKWLTINGTTTYGGGVVSSIGGVAKGYFYVDNVYATVQGVSGIGTKLQSNGVDALTIPTSGNVLIGTTTDDGVNKLQVNGSGRFIGVGELTVEGTNTNVLGVINLKGTSVGATNYVVRQGIVGVSNGGFSLRDETNTANRFAISSTGVVGIMNLSGSGTRVVTADASGNLSASSTPPDTRPYKVYVALISQSGTSAPTATVLENTLGGTVVWTRTGSGSYVATLAGVFTTNKTVIFVNNSDASFGYSVSLNTGDGTIHWENGADGRMNNTGTMIEIRVYP